MLPISDPSRALTLAAAPPVEGPARPGLSVTDLWMALIVVIGLVLLVSSLRRRTEKKIEASEGAGLARLEALRTQARERFGAGPPPRRDESDPGRDMEELAERLSAQLDAKADRLERLIERAEARIVELQGMAAATRAGPGAGVPQVEPKPALRPAEAPASPQHARVQELADRGLSVVEIARTLDMPTGQVQLILNLRKVPSAL
jgi:hypothetical protein